LLLSSSSLASFRLPPLLFKTRKTPLSTTEKPRYLPKMDLNSRIRNDSEPIHDPKEGRELEPDAPSSYIVSSTIKGRSQAGRLTRRGKLPLPDGFPISLHSTTKPPAVSELRTIIGTPRHYCHPRPDNPPCDKIATSAPTHSPPKCSCCVIPRNARTTLPLAGDPPLKSAIHHR
jgi:hypothetical protein